MVNVTKEQNVQKMPEYVKSGGFKIYFKEFEAGERLELNKNTYIFVIEGEMSSPFLLRGRKSIPYNSRSSLECTFDRESLVLIAELENNEAEMKDHEGFEWRHITELVPHEDKNKEMWYSDPYFLYEYGNKKYRLRFWLMGPNVNGGIHDHKNDKPPFKEIHMQLKGFGYMEKFYPNGQKISEVLMRPGDSHDPFYVIEDGKIFYPPHQYRSGEKGSLFLVVEELCKFFEG